MNTDPNIKIIKHIYQLKRGEQDAVEEKNPTPLSGEPIVIFGNDGETRLKIGDGETPVNDCNIIGENAGQFADKTNSDEIFRVGNGTSDENRSNAFVVHEDGRATVQSEPEEDNDVVTKKYVDDNAGETQAEIDELKANKADKDKVIDLLTYQIRYDSTTGTTVRITGIKQGAVLPSTLRIPDYIEGYPVTEISGYAFQSNNRISKLYIPDTIETIQDYAFAYCTQLYIVYLGRRTNWVRSGAFRGCTHLKYVYFRTFYKVA